MQTETLQQDRAIATGNVWTEQGRLVAAVSQEMACRINLKAPAASHGGAKLNAQGRPLVQSKL